MKKETGVLRGVKVLDLTRVLAGPYCGMLLADMGADVIKVERPGKGDDSRAFYPQINGESAYYINLNRNKRGITLDLKSDAGKQTLLELVEQADILIENYRPGTMDKLGLGFKILHARNPRLVYGCVSGFGQYGRKHDLPGYDIIGQAAGGLMSVSGWPGGEPTRTGTAMADVLGGLSLSAGILAAYIDAQRTGQGRMVDVALVDSVVSSLEIINQIYLVKGRVPERSGNRYESCAPYDSFRARDGSLVIACGNDKLFRLLAGAMQMPELTQDERFFDNMHRLQNQAELKAIIEGWLQDKCIDETVAMLLQAGVPASPINTIDRVVNDPHIAQDREMFVDCEHPVAGRLKLTGNHIKLSGAPCSISPAPLLGQHTEEVLGEWLSYSTDRVERLRQQGAL